LNPESYVRRPDRALSSICSTYLIDASVRRGTGHIEVSLKSLQIDEKGWSLLWKKEHTDQSTIEVRLATRINISSI